MNLDSAQILALQKAKITLDAEALPVGKYEVDFEVTLRVQGSLQQCKGGEYTPTVSVPLKAALALVLEKSGVTREASAKILVEAMTEALEAGVKGEGPILDRITDIEVAEARVKAAMANLPKQPRKGALRTDVTAAVVQSKKTVDVPALVS